MEEADRLSVDQPQQRRDDDDYQRRAERQVEPEVLAINDDVAGNAVQTDLLQHRSEQAGGDQDDPEDDQPAGQGGCSAKRRWSASEASRRSAGAISTG